MKLFGLLIVIMLFLIGAFSGCINNDPGEPIDVVDELDAVQYAGLWYSVYELPVFYGLYPFGYSSEKCVNSTATYTIESENTIHVLNKCILRGREQQVEGTARYANSSNKNGALIVNFFGFDSDYNVIGLDEEYQWAVIGTKNRESLWLFSRTPTIDEPLLDEMKDIAEAEGFDTSQLYKVKRER
ncbi:MAG TPA: lipocalin family protein [Candidatus Thermoplasmatota archaeon]|nr:lipocalin family protein [Candidatus Thermoplasmatota archaeon]